MIVELTGCQKEIEFKPRSQATFVKNRIGCPEKAYKDLDFKADINLMDGLRDLIKWREEHKSQVEARRIKSEG